jgi:hypothetical protein
MVDQASNVDVLSARPMFLGIEYPYSYIGIRKRRRGEAILAVYMVLIAGKHQRRDS